VRTRPDGQLVVEVFPQSAYDKLLLSGIRAEVWMEPGVTAGNLQQNMAAFYRRKDPEGVVSLVLGAGNVASIAPLDVLYKLYAEGSGCLLKMNPVNDYLGPVLEAAFAEFTDAGYVATVYGGADVGAYVAEHSAVDEIHITGSARSHDVILFGPGPEGDQRKRDNRPRTAKRMTSELGNVSPTIVVPGPWSDADVKFQAAHLATQKMHNGGFNCIPRRSSCYRKAGSRAPSWSRRWSRSLAKRRGARPTIPEPGIVGAPWSRHLRTHSWSISPPMTTSPALSSLALTAPPTTRSASRSRPLPACWPSPASLVATPGTTWSGRSSSPTPGFGEPSAPTSWFTPPPSRRSGPGSRTPSPSFATAVSRSTPGPAWDSCWRKPAGAPFPATPRTTSRAESAWLHNSLLFDRPQKSVIYQPFYPYPRGLLHGQMAMLPKPPWFITNKRADRVGKALVAFEANPSPLRLPAIFSQALRG
jgi:aldehyde dehydrogenase (NAD(P)+)